ncbi:hypothetical protein CONLIGDRAFT_573934 [Coniochaeta ligniaria NRRL 30616]|uniref:Uncharacterized protein n=1 Tax=Coniochaeta ligniaria NRRL 30616 TaxID=1408157 RepID=A0A1J7JN01_9PEZI|nr:hypothetical protein CONLIGDRAFT_573934 [Coniochaeta ligniaria NRRL 30616]
MSADTVSSLFPDRPIRPLPKRRLRERLSPDVAESIQYPPAPQTTTPLFYYSYNPRDDEYEPAPYGRRESRPGLLGPTGGRNGLGIDDDDDAARMSRIASLAMNMSDSMTRPARTLAKQDHAKHPNSHPPQSAASSADGYYDPFEITNNKKKRKIPTAGETTLGGSHSMNDGMHGPESPGTPIQSVEGHGEQSSPIASSSYGPGGFGSSTHNVSGPGRGRYVSLLTFFSLVTAENTGIISTAIANAEKLPPHPGQENLSLLQQQHSAKTEPATTQFTFTCDSQVPGGVAWPGTDRRHTVAVPHASAAARQNGGRLSAPAAYPPSTLPTRQMADQITQSAAAKPLASAPAAPAAAAPPKKTRKRLNKELNLAAKHRKENTLFANQRNPPKDEDFWICEFCEYENIFGQPPLSLIRKYELRDRRERKQAAERQRLLEKAKMKSRKGKKNSKPAATKNSAPAQDRTTPQGDASAPHPAPTQGQGHEGEEYHEEEDYENRGQEAGTENGTTAASQEVHGGGDGTEGHRPLRPPTVPQPNLDDHVSTAQS